MSTWRPLLRLAWRDAFRAKGRSALVLALIALPVLAVTIADIVIATQDVTGTEALERRLGAADARVSIEGARVFQGADPDWSSGADGPASKSALHPDDLGADLGAVLGGDVRVIPRRQTEKRVETDGGATMAGFTLLDLADPLAVGFTRLEDGRLPASPDEAFVNRELADRGPGLGETLTLTNGTELEVVGVGEDASTRSWPQVYALPGAVAVPRSSASWLVDAPGPVTWEQVRALNQRGAAVLSRAVMLDPPAEDELAPQLRGMSAGPDDAAVAVAVLVVTMVLLEVVLLAGPAFAVTARRQSRNLALMAATGGTPRQARRAILATGVVLGTVGAVLGIVLGILLAWVAAVPIAQHYSGSFFGPFDVPWLHLAAVAGFGFASAVLAAAVPAWIASRQDVVAVLAGRRGDRAPSARSPLLGLVLLGAGGGGAWYGATRSSSGEVFIAASAIVSVLGMVLLVPVVVAALARVSGRLPLTLRYAVRDAARHRTRTVPAVAAVAATVAGVVALGIANTSDSLESEMTYSPQVAMGDGLVSSSGAKPEQWREIEAAVRRTLPEATVTSLAGVPFGARAFTDVSYRVPGGPRDLLLSYGGSLGTSNVVSDDVPSVVTGLDDGERARAEAMLADGGVVVFTSQDVAAEQVRVVGRRSGRGGQSEKLFGPAELPATYVQVDDRESSLQAVLSHQAADELGVEARTVGITVSGTDLTRSRQQAVNEATEAVVPYASLYVERGYQPDEADRIVLWVLGALGAVLMLGGTLTATFLALSDARPDLATLSAVGAAPRTRRGVAAAYALVVGLVGAALGAAVGFIPGVAVTHPLTSSEGSWMMEGSGAVNGIPDATGPFLDIPWLLIAAIVVALPLLTALVVGVSARSRLPLVARLD